MFLKFGLLNSPIIVISIKIDVAKCGIIWLYIYIYDCVVCCDDVLGGVGETGL